MTEPRVHCCIPECRRSFKKTPDDETADRMHNEIMCGRCYRTAEPRLVEHHKRIHRRMRRATRLLRLKSVQRKKELSFQVFNLDGPFQPRLRSVLGSDQGRRRDEEQHAAEGYCRRARGEARESSGASVAMWTVVEDDRFEHREDLIRADDGAVLGTIMRFYEDGPTYAWTISGGRIGPISPLGCALEGVERGDACDAAARKRVETLAGLSPEDQNFATAPASGAKTPH